MSSKDAIESASKGATKAILEWSEEKVKLLVQQFRHRDIAFVQDVETIEVALEQRKMSEWDLFQKNILDGRLRILFQMGLTLRRVEHNRKQCSNLRDRIVKKYGVEGLHIAQFVQNGLFSKFIGSILEKPITPEGLKSEIENLFENIERTNSFIQIEDNVEKEADKVVTRIQSFSPGTYIISGSKSAREKCEEVKDIVMRRISGYSLELYKTDIKEIYFLNKVEKIARR